MKGTSTFNFNIQNLIFSSGLGRKLLFYFLLAALLPMTVVSFSHYQQSQKTQLAQIESRLQEIASSEAEELRVYYQHLTSQLTMLSEMRQNIALLVRLIQAHTESGLEPFAFSHSLQWAELAEQGYDLNLFCRSMNSQDILLIDRQGNILYTVARKNDLGANLLTGVLEDSDFAGAFRKTMSTGRLAFADYAIYPPSGTGLGYCFFTAPMVDAQGERIGVIAMVLPVSDLDSMLLASLGDQGEVYLVSKNGRLSASQLDPTKKGLSAMEETEQYSNWLNHLQNYNINSEVHGQKGEKIARYKGPHGRIVYGLHNTILIADTPLAVFAEMDEETALAPLRRLRTVALSVGFITGFLALILSTLYTRQLVRPIRELATLSRRVAGGDFTDTSVIQVKYELAELAENFSLMQRNLRENALRNREDEWRKQALASLNIALRGEQEVIELADNVTGHLARYVNAQVGAFFVRQKDNFVLHGGFACLIRDQEAKNYSMGEGLVGQTAKEQQSIQYTKLPGEHLPLDINSGLSQSAPAAVLALPMVYEGVSLGVLEFGRVDEFTPLEIEVLEEAVNSISIALNTALNRQRTNELLAETQRQSQELQSQQEELKTANEELEEQTVELRKSQQRLREQSAELKVANEELEEKNQRLQEQKGIVVKAKAEVEQQAEQLALASRYKSEFLANMSHELRSPLNSLLILARSLADNQEGNLSQEQVEEAEIIHKSGTELLHLINDILDLSKVEAGKLTIHNDEIRLRPFCKSICSSFMAQAREKGVALNCDCNPVLPEVFISDEQRLGQILKNLLSNGLKFTREGKVCLSVSQDKGKLVFRVRDTGIGIPVDKQQAIFEAFQQADGSTTRQYGGTGLGLTISRQLTELLGGTLTVESEEGEGSTFTLILPLANEEDQISHFDVKGGDDSGVSGLGLRVKDKDNFEDQHPNFERFTEDSWIKRTDDNGKGTVSQLGKEKLAGKKILVVDDDMRNTFAFSGLLRKAGLTTVLAADGIHALDRLIETPDIDVVLMDMMMPNMDGFETIREIRQDERFKDLRIIALTAKAMSGDRQQCLAAGADDYLAKPVEKEELLAMILKMLDAE